MAEATFQSRRDFVLWFLFVGSMQSLFSAFAQRFGVPAHLVAPAGTASVALFALFVHGELGLGDAGEALLMAAGTLLGECLSPSFAANAGEIPKAQERPVWKHALGPLIYGGLRLMQRVSAQLVGVDRGLFDRVGFLLALLISVPWLQWPHDSLAGGEELLDLLAALERGEVDAEECKARAKELLLARHANPNLTEKKTGRTCLQLALATTFELKSTDVVEILLTRGANPNGPRRDSGKTALMEACDTAQTARKRKSETWKEDFEYILDLLLRFGASLHQKDTWRETALGVMAGVGEREICEMLMERGADPSLANVDGVTPERWFKQHTWDFAGKFAFATS